MVAAGSTVGVGSALVVGAALVLVVELVEVADAVVLVEILGAGSESGAPHAVSRSAAATIGNMRFMMRFCFRVGIAKFKDFGCCAKFGGQARRVWSLLGFG
ncbi:hypothetical protein HMPREF0281_00429 [Corynebacterium ammoniagenes DSM 20306]|uniref:Secreted protein n=1 Tax=Corynebacterium ammoniagenes DSM 20306 TaxID=649754 RepID=A0ABN0AHP5_CORAM|nr:hypothetical protein HMPREF0281_00429 [Corynebacterium ammoniagenes DSM 20306]